MSHTVIIPQTLYETLQTAFLAEGKRLAADAARILGVDEKELVKKLFSSNRVAITLVEDSERPLSCLVPIQENVVLRRCRRPCVLGTSRCVSHQDITHIPELEADIDSSKILTRLGTHPDIKEPLWVAEETSQIFNSKGNCVGRRTDDGIQLWAFPSEGLNIE